MSASRQKPEENVRRETPENDLTIAALSKCATNFCRRKIRNRSAHCHALSFSFIGADATRWLS